MWPEPPGWKSESFPFPLAFAKGVARRGHEEARFPPGFMKKDSPEFWSYVFAWFLEDDRPLDAPRLSIDLVAYYDGLDDDVGDTTNMKPPEHTSTVVDLHDDLTGVITTWDVFLTGAQIHLHARIAVRACGAHHVAVFELSPAPADAAIWRDLDALAAAAPCV